ncbi:MAG: GntR family transcriptional regulator [Verrucomicrobia bacterium]|nr:GntR family transcriptional regulator [Verrucomicrobiota bacterium]
MSLRSKKVISAAPGSLAERAYLDIRGKILRGDLPVGAALSRRQLATELDVSVPPVTEALQRLEAEGLVESEPRAGTRVRVPTRLDVEERYLLREALEVQSARLFAERATGAEKKEILAMGRKVDRRYAQCETGDVDRETLFAVNTYHMELHLRIAECARCGLLRDAIEREQVLVFNWLFDTVVERRTLAADYHTSLTEALATGTPDGAASAMRRHIRRGLGQVLTKIDLLGELPGGWRRKKSAE